MGHPEQFLNRFMMLLLIALIPACNSPADMGNINRANKHLRQLQGVLYFNGSLFTGSAYELFENGDTAKITSYKNGKQDGVMKWWYPNKQLAQKRFFVDGRKEGIHKGWWPDGRIKFEYHFANDEYEGEVKEWYNTGKVFRIFHYAAGHEAGSQKMWWDDGSVRANYVIINGEKFGLFGQKLCVNDLKK
jgi:antitoxin component YwqK of YwqJK toxin-antitoxin module